MVASHQLPELLTTVLGGVVLGALFTGVRSMARTTQRWFGLLQCCGLVLRGLALVAGFYLFAGANILNLSLCALGFSIAGLEMRRLAGTSSSPSRQAPVDAPAQRQATVADAATQTA